MCPSCKGLNIEDITDQDDPVRIFFCGQCAFQGAEIEFVNFDEPEACGTTTRRGFLGLMDRFVQWLRAFANG